jgi:hypothetical protein
MGESGTQQLRAINSQLIELYLRLYQLSTDENAEQSIRSKIVDLETDKDRLPNAVLHNDKFQQYIIILRSAASSLQLQRQTEYQFLDRKKSELSPDEIRQKNIRLNKRNSIEKKIKTYRQKLSDMGLSPFDLDDIVLEGYREQNQRLSQKLLKSLELTISDYFEEYYQNNGNLPVEFYSLIQSWENADNRDELTYNQLRILDAKAQCMQKGIPYFDVVMRIESVSQWNDDKKERQLRVLKSKLKQEKLIVSKDVNLLALVKEWTQQVESGKRLKPNQVSIVMLINEMQMYGVSQDKIEAVLESRSPKSNGFLSVFTNRFRRNS